jgi:lysophospholipase L1-like esterase
MSDNHIPAIKRIAVAALILFTIVPTLANAQTPSAVTGQVVCHGDSLTYGSNASSGWGTATGPVYPGVLADKLGSTWRVTSIGTPGWTMDGLMGQAPSRVDPLYDPTLKYNILVVFGGTNDIGCKYETADQTYAKLVAYCKARKAAHPWKILVLTPPMAAYPKVYPGDFDYQMVRYDEKIRQNWPSFADGIVDVQADPRMGTPGAEHNAEYFSAKDFTHLTDAGYRIVGTDAYNAVENITAKRHRFLGIF